MTAYEYLVQITSDFLAGRIDKEHEVHIRRHISELRALEVHGDPVAIERQVAQIEQDFTTAYEVMRVYGV